MEVFLENRCLASYRDIILVVQDGFKSLEQMLENGKQVQIQDSNKVSSLTYMGSKLVSLSIHFSGPIVITKLVLCLI